MICIKINTAAHLPYLPPPPLHLYLYPQLAQLPYITLLPVAPPPLLCPPQLAHLPSLISPSLRKGVKKPQHCPFANTLAVSAPSVLSLSPPPTKLQKQ